MSMSGTRELFFLLTRENDSEVFLLSGQEGHELPVWGFPVPANVGFKDPSPYNAWFTAHYGIPVIRRYVLDHDGLEHAVFVLEALNEVSAPEGTAWRGVDELGSLPFARDDLRFFLEKWASSSRDSVTMPWVKEKWQHEPFRWTAQRLEERKAYLTESIKQIKNTYVSCVYHYPTNIGNFFLKIVPPLFIREVEVVAMLREWKIVMLPEYVAIDPARGFMLMYEMGGHDLEEHSPCGILLAAVEDIAKFQLASCPFVLGKNTWPLYDLRHHVLAEETKRLPDLVASFLDESPYRFSRDELNRLRQRLPEWTVLNHCLHDFCLPDALDHGDLRPDNIRVLPGGFVFYDWAWPAVTCPFYGIAEFLHRIQTGNHAENEMLKEAYLEPWRDICPHKDLRRAFNIAEQLIPLYGSIFEAERLNVVLRSLSPGLPTETQPDAWTLRRRQYYFSRMIRRLL